MKYLAKIDTMPQKEPSINQWGSQYTAEKVFHLQFTQIFLANTRESAVAVFGRLLLLNYLDGVL